MLTSLDVNPGATAVDILPLYDAQPSKTDADHYGLWGKPI